MLKTTHRLFLITFLVMGLTLTLTTISFSAVGATPVNHSPLTAPLSLGVGTEEGYTHLSLLSVFGPMAHTAMGDPYSPLNSPW